MGRVLSLSAVILLLWVGLAGAATEVICIVDTDPTAEADYHSLADAIAGETGASPKCVTSADLVANDEQLTIECRASAGGADTTAVTVQNFTTSESCFVYIYTPSGHRHSGKYSTSKYRIEKTNSTVISCFQDHVKIEGLQIKVTGTSGNRNGILQNGHNVHILKCIIWASFSDTAAGFGVSCLTAADAATYVINNVIIDFNNGTSTSCRGISSTTDNDSLNYFYNNTIINCYRGIQIGSLATGGYIKNNIVYGSEDAYYGNANNAATNISETETYGAGSSTTSQTTAQLFTDYDNDDFSVKDTDSDLYDAGTDLSAYFTTDIAGTTRSTWDIGAFEYVSGPKWNTITPAKWNGVDWSNLKWNGM